MLITGKCHCGNIAFELEWKGDPHAIPARACGCSFCVKHGGVWTSHPGSRLVVAVRDGALVSKYVFGSGTATFHVCSRCGAVPLVTSEIANQLYAVVNVNVFENVDESRLRRATADFESEDVESRLARRKRNWIADVRIAEGR
ncbi:MAG: GFA family protein [Terriglobia bacterium]